MSGLGSAFRADRYATDPPAGIEERQITTSDGLRLGAWYVAAPRARASVVWSHGNAVSIARRPGALRAFAARGLSVLAYDYRGFGRSEGRPSEAGMYRDALAAFDSERARGVPAERIVCFGESLGGAVSIYLASRRPCAAVAVVSTFTRLRDLPSLHRLLRLVGGRRFDSLARVRRLTVPIFIAHGDCDEFAPFALGERLFAAANAPKRFFRAAGARHGDVLATPGLVDAVAGFVAEGLPVAPFPSS
jgi:hypothetical protein